MSIENQVNKKVFIADCQVFQEPAWHRGMGKYSIALLVEMSVNKDFSSEYSLKLLLNSNLPKDEEMLDQINSLLPNADIIWLDLPTYKEGKSLIKVQSRCKTSLDDFIDNKFESMDVTFIIMSLFLQFACPVYPSNSKKVLLYYDLIMLQYYQMYLGLGASEQHFAHYKTLFESDVILSISKTVANDLTLYLGITKENIVNIDGAPIKRKEIVAKKPGVGLSKKIILMPSGGDPRKNNHRAVQGFNEFNSQNGQKYSLVLTSSFGKGMQKELESLSEDVIFTGNIEEAELAWLYKNCEAVLFAPEYEGLGMPILEAADYGKPVACSDISVFREISPTAFYYFDHTSPSDIARSLSEIFDDLNYQKKEKEYKSILEEYSWTNTAVKAISAIKTHEFDKQIVKKKMAVIAPNLQTNSYIGYLAALQYPTKTKGYDVDFYYDFGVNVNAVRPNHLAFTTSIYSAADLDSESHSEYDKVIYYVDDREDSLITVAKSQALPGTVHLFSSSIMGAYKDMQSQHIISGKRFALEQKISKILGDNQQFLGSLINSSKSIVVSSSIKKQITPLLQSLKYQNAVASNKNDLLPELPYKIAEAKTNTNAVLYVSGSINNNSIDKLTESVDTKGRLSIVFGGDVNEACVDSIAGAIDHINTFYSPTDFQLVGLLQKATKVYILSKKDDIEGIFVSERCSQLGKKYIIVSPNKEEG